MREDFKCIYTQIKNVDFIRTFYQFNMKKYMV